MLTNVMNRQNVGMTEGGDRARFLLETTQAFGVGRKGCGRIFSATSRPETQVARPIDFAHSSSTDEGYDFVRSELGTGDKGHG